MGRAKRLLLLIPHKSQLKEDIKYNRKKGENIEEAKTITRWKSLIVVVKRDTKTPTRKKLFNTLTKCKIKYPSYKT